MRPRRSAFVVAIVVASVAASLAPAGATGPPPDRSGAARRGLVFDGLTPAEPGGRCAPLRFEIHAGGGAVTCTHGPDPAPEGVDVTEPVPTAELRTRAGETAEPGAAAQCDGDGVSGHRIQAVYAHAADVANRYAQVQPLIRQGVADLQTMIMASAEATGGTRSARFVTDAACEPTVLNVTLSAAGDDSFKATIDEMVAKGYDESNRHYLIWMDATLLCGIGEWIPVDDPGQGNPNNGTYSRSLFGRTDVACWEGTTVVHELFHTLGAVQYTAPNSNDAGHCTDDHDIMCYDDPNGTTPTIVCADEGLERRLDCRHDDYFHTDPPAGSYLDTHWNTADSAFLTQDVCTIEGTVDNDVLTGTPGADVMCGGDGNDVFRSSAGDDVVFGGAGIDTTDYSAETAPIEAALRLERVVGPSSGTDTVSGIERVLGTRYPDTIEGGNGRDTLLGSGGNDYLYGHGERDALVGSAGNDYMAGGAGNDRMTGGLGVDWVSFYGLRSPVVVDLAAGTATGQGGDTLRTVESVYGSNAGDTLRGAGNHNYMHGYGGNDVFYGRGGSDQLFGYGGRDRAYGGDGNDYTYGFGGDDALYGEGGRDAFNGGPGVDLCRQGPGSGRKLTCERA